MTYTGTMRSAHGEPLWCGHTGSSTETGVLGMAYPHIPVLISLLIMYYPML